MPSTDIWWLTDNDSNSQNYRYNFKFDFTYFESKQIKAVVKEYIWINYITGNRVVLGLRTTLWCLTHFDAFCRENKLHSLRSLDNGLADDYRTFLRVRVLPTTGKPLSYFSQSRCFSMLKAIVGWCQVFLPKAVPEKQIFTGNEYSRTHRQLKVEYIPDEILQSINEALKTEDNPYLKNGIIILKCTGMRIGDLLLLTTDCLSEHPISGHTISWFEHKNRKNRNNVPIPLECKNAVEDLLRITGSIRNRAVETEKERLFIYAPKRASHKKPVTLVSINTFGRWCRCFSEKHNIRDCGGNIYNISSHMFRRTLATDMLSKGVNLKVIQDLLGHASPATTKRYYADVKDSERATMFSQIGILGNIQQISLENIPNKLDLLWFQRNCSGRARLSDGYCTLPIEDGKPCGHYLSRLKCYLCSRYITTLEDLDAHRTHLCELEELLENNIYGNHYAAHIIPTTIALREIIRRLEGMQNE